MIDKAGLFDYHETMKKIDLVKIFKALASEQRLNIFIMLYKWNQTAADGTAGFFCSEEGVEKCFTKTCDCMDLSRSTISHHFKELENAGLITCTRIGQSSVCKVNMEAVKAIRGFLE